jgi:hypothetical protein
MSIINPGGIGSGLDTIEQIMTFINDLGGGNGLAPLEQVVANNSAPSFATITLSSGVAHVNATASKQLYFVGITGGTAGTVGITVTDLSSTVHTIIPVVAADAVSSQSFVIPVPAGWSITVTTSVATINANTVVATGL